MFGSHLALLMVIELRYFVVSLVYVIRFEKATMTQTHLEMYFGPL